MAKLAQKKIAIIGAGWAGCAAAVKLAQQGHQITLIEAARTLGGRARGVEVRGKMLDNGQHIMLGAYSTCLQLMRSLQIPLDQALMRLPLQMVYPEQTGMHFVAPRLPAPLHVLIALAFARGLSSEDKLALARFSTSCRWMEWKLDQDCSVEELLMRFDQTENLCRLMWRPLCIAALNTPSERASAQVFLNVLRDSLGANRAASDMLIPKQDLSTLLPTAAANFIQKNGGQIIVGLTVKKLQRSEIDPTCWQLRSNHESDLHKHSFDAVILATQAEQAHMLMETAAGETALQAAPQFDYEPICTCYLQYAPALKLERVFYALLDAPEQGQWGQFVFDRGQLNQDHAGLLAVVISASSTMTELSHEKIAHDIAMQLASAFKRAELATPIWHQIITEKRATFACTPKLKRPDNLTPFPTLLIAGDYTAGDYPATLEAAVRSGNLAANKLIETLKKH